MTVRLLTNIGRLWTGSEVWSNAAILTHNDRIAWVGRASELPESLPGVVEDIVDGDSVENVGGGRRGNGLDGHGDPRDRPRDPVQRGPRAARRVAAVRDHHDRGQDGVPPDP